MPHHNVIPCQHVTLGASQTTMLDCLYWSVFRGLVYVMKKVNNVALVIIRVKGLQHIETYLYHPQQDKPCRKASQEAVYVLVPEEFYAVSEVDISLALDPLVKCESICCFKSHTDDHWRAIVCFSHNIAKLRVRLAHSPLPALSAQDQQAAIAHHTGLPEEIATLVGDYFTHEYTLEFLCLALINHLRPEELFAGPKLTEGTTATCCSQIVTSCLCQAYEKASQTPISQIYHWDQELWIQIRDPNTGPVPWPKARYCTNCHNSGHREYGHLDSVLGDRE